MLIWFFPLVFTALVFFLFPALQQVLPWNWDLGGDDSAERSARLLSVRNQTAEPLVFVIGPAESGRFGAPLYVKVVAPGSNVFVGSQLGGTGGRCLVDSDGAWMLRLFPDAELYDGRTDDEGLSVAGGRSLSGTALADFEIYDVRAPGHCWTGGNWPEWTIT